MSPKHRYTPSNYAASKNEVGVFTTPGYSEHVKPLWRFKNAEEAKKSAEGIWELFEGYRNKKDFVGMDICRKFIQMGRTRSLRYALRPGGKKYDSSTGKEKKRTGKVYDQGKLDGANIYEKWLDKCWNDKVYKDSFDNWKEGKVTDIEADEEGNDHDVRKSDPQEGGDEGSYNSNTSQDQSNEVVMESEEEEKLARDPDKKPNTNVTKKKGSSTSKKTDTR